MHAGIGLLISLTAVLFLFPSGFLLKKLMRGMWPVRPEARNDVKKVSWTLYCAFAFWLVLAIQVLRAQNDEYWLLRFLGSILGVAGFQCSCVGLTGGIASGKSTAAKYVRDQLGYKVIDSDDIARQVVKRGTGGFNAIVNEFGASIVDKETGEIDRSALGSIVFQDPRKKRALERITHPRILFRILASMAWYRLRGYKVVVDVPLLFESSSPLLYHMCSECILVDAPVEQQRVRIKARNAELSESDIERRIQSQMSREDRRKFADYIVDNSGTLPSLHRQLDALLKDQQKEPHS